MCKNTKYILYNIANKVESSIEKDAFAQRLTKLRMEKGVSARDMSLSIGQSENYINSIENGKSYPSMAGFFYICDYLNISPQDFFDEGIQIPAKLNELLQEAKYLNSQQLEHLIAIIKDLRKCQNN